MPRGHNGSNKVTKPKWLTHILTRLNIKLRFLSFSNSNARWLGSQNHDYMIKVYLLWHQLLSCKCTLIKYLSNPVKIMKTEIRGFAPYLWRLPLKSLYLFSDSFHVVVIFHVGAWVYYCNFFSTELISVTKEIIVPSFLLNCLVSCSYFNQPQFQTNPTSVWHLNSCKRTRWTFCSLHKFNHVSSLWRGLLGWSINIHIVRFLPSRWEAILKE